MNKWTQLAEKELLEKTVQVLKNNGIDAFVVDTGEQAKKKVLEILPKNTEVMNMTSITLDTIGLTKEIIERDTYSAVRKKLMKMDRKTEHVKMQKLGAAPEWVVGSVHAVTEGGQIVIASNTGSQLSAYAYGSAHVILVVGTQKIVESLEEGLQRVYEHSLLLEGERVKRVYGLARSAVNKLLIINKEVVQGRITIIFVKEVLGF